MGILTSFLWLSLNIYHEARGEDFLGQLAVAHVTLNRSRERNLPVKQVVLQPNQFSWTSMPKRKWWPKDPIAFLNCMESATAALTGYDFTRGATHYHNYRVKPYWAASYEHIADIGRHRFYR